MASRSLYQSAATGQAVMRTATVAPQLRRASNTPSTAAVAYKALRQRHAPLPVSSAPPAWNAPSAVSNILYETPTHQATQPDRHILNCLVQDEPGVLSRVSGILAARGFNIHSLAVCKTEVQDLSRVTIVLTGQREVVEQARRQLEDMVPVWAVLNYTDVPLVQRELLLVKVNILGPEYYDELLHYHREVVAAAAAAAAQEDPQEPSPSTSELSLDHVAQDFHPSKIAASEALRQKHEHLKSITYFAQQFKGKVLDISTNSCIVQLSAKPNRIDSFLKLVAPFGILEAARTGVMVMPRTSMQKGDDGPSMDADDVVDASQLPPG